MEEHRKNENENVKMLNDQTYQSAYIDYTTFGKLMKQSGCRDVFDTKKSSAMTYCPSKRSIVGAVPFHISVRNVKRWYQNATMTEAMSDSIVYRG